MRNLLEESPQETPRQTVHDAAAECPIRKRRCLAELVTPRECHRIRDCENQGDSYNVSVYKVALKSRGSQPTHQLN